MKYLKFFFENSDQDPEKFIPEEDIEECFYDITDDDWILSTGYGSRAKSERNIGGGTFTIKYVDYVTISIYSNFIRNGRSSKPFYPGIAGDAISDLNNLRNSDIFKNCMSQLIGRVKEKGYKIVSNRVEGTVLKIRIEK